MGSYAAAPEFNSISDGDEVVIRKGYHNHDLRVVTLRFQESVLVDAVAADGATFAFKRTSEYGRFQSADGETWTLYYSHPLPELDTESRIAYAMAMTGEAAPYPRAYLSQWTDPSAVLVDEIDEERVTAWVLSHRLGYETDDEDGVRRLSFKAVGETELISGSKQVGSMFATIEPVTLDRASVPAEAVRGSVIVAGDITVKINEHGAVGYLVNPALLPAKAGLDTVERLFPSRKNTSDRWGFQPRCSLEPVGSWLFKVEMARRSADADELLVAVFPDLSHPGHTSGHIAIIAGRGGLFYSDPSYLHDEICQGGEMTPGVVHVTSVRAWGYTSHEGEHDAGIDFAHEPADEAVLSRFGFDMASFGETVRGYLDEEEDKRFEGMEAEEIAAAMFALNRPATTPPPAVGTVFP